MVATEEVVTVAELLQRIDAAMERMGRKNGNRLLLMQCRAAIMYLAQHQVPSEVVTRGGIILS